MTNNLWTVWHYHVLYRSIETRRLIFTTVCKFPGVCKNDCTDMKYWTFSTDASASAAAIEVYRKEWQTDNLQQLMSYYVKICQTHMEAIKTDSYKLTDKDKAVCCDVWPLTLLEQTESLLLYDTEQRLGFAQYFFWNWLLHRITNQKTDFSKCQYGNHCGFFKWWPQNGHFQHLS